MEGYTIVDDLAFHVVVVHDSGIVKFTGFIAVKGVSDQIEKEHHTKQMRPNIDSLIVNHK